MTAEYLEAVCREGQTVNPVFTLLGVRVLEVNIEHGILQCVIGPDLIQGAGVLAGGMLATFADEAMAHAVLARIEPNQRTATVEMSVRYLRPLHEGDTVTAKAWVLKKGRAIVTAECEVVDGKGRLAAKAAASFMILG